MLPGILDPLCKQVPGLGQGLVCGHQDRVPTHPDPICITMLHIFTEIYRNSCLFLFRRTLVPMGSPLVDKYIPDTYNVLDLFKSRNVWNPRVGGKEGGGGPRGRAGEQRTGFYFYIPPCSLGPLECLGAPPPQ